MKSRRTFAGLILLIAGCGGGGEDSGNGEDDSLAGVELQLLVVDDPAMAAAAAQLAGEWNELTQSELQVRPIAGEDLTDDDLRAADAIICASHMLATLAERELIAPVPDKLLPDRILQDGRLIQQIDTDGKQAAAADAWAGVFDLLRVREAVWGQKLYAVPFGSPVLTCYYRVDLLQQLGRRPPETWTEYQELAELLGDLGNLASAEQIDRDAWCGTVEPLGPPFGGLVLLARAAAYAKHRDDYATLFQMDSMEPLIAQPPFVRALEELVAAAKLNPADPLQPAGALSYDPAGARAAFWQGRCGLALCWPTAAKDGQPPEADPGIPVDFVELPGSAEIYSRGNPQPQRRADDEDPRVTLLGVAGRLGVVSAESEHGEGAFRLLFWLSGEKHGPQVSGPSPATTLFRRAHVDSPQPWVEGPLSESAATEYAKVTKQALMRPVWLFALRIPGREKYLAALDEAVRKAVLGELTPGEALAEAADRWRAVTDSLGPQQQQAAYRNCVKWE